MRKALNNDAGCENFYVLRESSKVVKLSTILFEENNKIGRLFDADVLIKGKLHFHAKSSNTLVAAAIYAIALLKSVLDHGDTQ